MQPRLTRSRTDRMIGGVCGGLGYYFGVDPVIVRLIFVVLAFTIFVTPFIYPILWLIMPEAPTTPSALPPDARFDPMTGLPLPPTSQATSTDQSSTPPPVRGRNRMLGFLLLGIGSIVLIENVGEALYRIFNIEVGGIVVPLLLVGLGLYLLRKKTM